MSTQYDYDLVVIGSGPAGEKGAAQAAYWGKKVALVERAEHLGGAGINTGTVPSKTLRETALYFSGLRQRGLYGIDYSLRDGLTIEDLMYRKGIVVVKERKLIARNLRRHGIELIRGTASLLDANTVQVELRSGGSRALTTGVILIATGSSPLRPEGVPFKLQSVYDSDEVMSMDRIPTTMAIVGGGVIGSEYACIFTALGVRVTLIDSKARLLPMVDIEIAHRLQEKLTSLGLDFRFNDRVGGIRAAEERVELDLESGEAIEAEVALFAAGRRSNTEGLGLEHVGVKMGERGLILVNQKYQTSLPNICAAGDVIGFPALAATSMEQGRVAMVHAFDLHYKEQVSPVLPFTVYTIPEISMVGLTEQECREKDIPYLVGRSYYDKNPRGLIIGDLSGMCKLIFAPEDKRLLGVHWIGEQASELIHLGAQVMAGGGTIDTFIAAVYNYPTLTDSYKYAAYDGLGEHQKWLANETR
ncbi:MAG TPA: Si-specific NAD(P)(+) transhydrogenase [Anaerolineales bacterium]|nr:Si-specific NAD(P)(+) transhydrogenase [Anaerolineales bacterium]